MSGAVAGRTGNSESDPGPAGSLTLAGPTKADVTPHRVLLVGSVT